MDTGADSTAGEEAGSSSSWDTDVVVSDGSTADDTLGDDTATGTGGMAAQQGDG